MVGRTLAEADLTDATVSTVGSFGVSSAKAADVSIYQGSLTVGGNLTMSAGTAADVLVAPGAGGGRVRGSVLVTGGTGDDSVFAAGLQVDRNLTLNLKGGHNQTHLGTAGQPLNVGGALTISGGAGTDGTS